MTRIPLEPLFERLLPANAEHKEEKLEALLEILEQCPDENIFDEGVLDRIQTIAEARYKEIDAQKIADAYERDLKESGFEVSDSDVFSFITFSSNNFGRGLTKGTVNNDNTEMNKTPILYSDRTQGAIELAIKVHEHDQKQKRKGKDIPYITHPLTVGLILARAGASEDVVIAGILHDTIEDCKPHGSITEQLLADRFGERVASLVVSVTEADKTLSWEERKEKALEHVSHLSHDSILVKSADVISNTSELYSDFKLDGVDTFSRFNASGPDMLIRAAKLIEALKKAWPDSPLHTDLEEAASRSATMYTIYRNERGESLGTHNVSEPKEGNVPEVTAHTVEEPNSQIRNIRKHVNEDNDREVAMFPTIDDVELGEINSQEALDAAIDTQKNLNGHVVDDKKQP